MTTTKINKYAGKCDCGTFVAAGQGILGGSKKDGWKTICRPCASGATPTPENAEPKRQTFPLTAEQEAAVAMFKEGRSFAIEAGAGTGKTSTLIAIANSTTRTGRYVAFNKAIVIEAGTKMPKNVTCSTQHSLAYQQVGKFYRHRIDGERMKTSEIAKRLSIAPFFCQTGEERKVLQPTTLASATMAAIKKFCSTAARVPGPEHFSYMDGIDLPDGEGNRTYANNDLMRDHLEDALSIAWEDLQRTDGSLRFEQDVYVKLWELGYRGTPVIPGDFIMVDEAQDMDPVMLSVIEQQAKQVVFVGDAQQMIYQWRGAVNAMKTVPAEDRTFLTNSFRFGEAIADVANKILTLIEDAELRLSGLGGPSIIEPTTTPDCVLTRTNAGAITVVLDALDSGRTAHLVGGGGEVKAFVEAARDLQDGKRTDHRELACFDSWVEVQQYVDQDPQGADLKLMVTLIDKYGIGPLLRAVSTDTPEEDADVVVSTAHKSKGREWDTVQLHGDFPERTGDDEYRLLYVAATRARKQLDPSPCAAAMTILYPSGPPAEWS